MTVPALPIRKGTLARYREQAPATSRGTRVRWRLILDITVIGINKQLTCIGIAIGALPPMYEGSHAEILEGCYIYERAAK
ncbi:hypothetical protein B0G80_5428 [Paraburkholderia sp. BL6669N2]|nr:hypothetical protein B0G80_5428 [Paraburkholderia sp. BL6669N2]